MYIVSKNKKSIINLDQIMCIYVETDGYTIKTNFKNGEKLRLGRYDSENDARAAIETIADNIGKTEVCFMPD